jgi:hypothetical protein
MAVAACVDMAPRLLVNRLGWNVCMPVAAAHCGGSL